MAPATVPVANIRPPASPTGNNNNNEGFYMNANAVASSPPPRNEPPPQRNEPGYMSPSQLQQMSLKNSPISPSENTTPTVSPNHSSENACILDKSPTF
jgi:hypothetical protein